MQFMIRKTVHGPRVLPVQDEEFTQMVLEGRAVKVPHMSRMYREVDAPVIEDLPIAEEVVVETKDEEADKEAELETKPVAENTYSTRAMQAEKPDMRAVASVPPRKKPPVRKRRTTRKPTGDAA